MHTSAVKMYSSSDEEEAVLFLALENEEKRRRKKRQVWVHKINLQRKECGEYHTLMSQLREDERRFYIYFRMNMECFDEMLTLIKEDITKMDTNYREALTAEERLVIALRYLATGDSFSTIGHSFRVGFSTVSKVVSEVCQAICAKMEEIYLPEPTEQIWQHSAEKFEELWQFPNCIGSLDGKHVTIKCPNKTGSTHYCYLKKFSVVLMAIVDPEYKFIAVDIGGYGKNSDSGIFENSNMGRRFERGLMNVPPPKHLPNQTESCRHVLIGDEAFALKPYLMRPFPYRQSKTNIHKDRYNYRLCRARRVVENAFGILVHKWRVFFRPILTTVPTTILLIRTACILHNFLRTKNCDDQFLHLLEDLDQQNKQDAFRPLILNKTRATHLAFNTRQQFVNYFNS